MGNLTFPSFSPKLITYGLFPAYYTPITRFVMASCIYARATYHHLREEAGKKRKIEY